MGTITKFEKIKAWKNARELTKLIYQISADEGFSVDFGLNDQIRRAAISIMSNIAEGFESHTYPLFIKYLGQARASAGEVRSQLYLAYDLGYISKEKLGILCDLARKVSSQIYKFVQYLKSQSNSQRM